MRKIAVSILCKIELEDIGSSNLLNEYSKKLSNVDGNFLRELVYGTLENRIFIDYVLEKLCKNKKKINNIILNILRISIYQIIFMEKVPDFAAINEAVNLTKKYGMKNLSGFVNGVLRNFIRNKDNLISIDVDDECEYISIKYSTNIELVKLLIEDYGIDVTKKILYNSMERPHFSIRINSKKNTEIVLNNLESKGYKLKQSDITDIAYIVENPSGIINTSSFLKGDFIVQDVGSILVSEMLCPKEDSMVLDICAAPGGKTVHLSGIMNGTGTIIANDLVTGKLKRIEENCKKMGVNNVILSNFDATIFQKEFEGKFDFILCDLICSGTGILDRKPEIKLFKKYNDIINIVDIQRKIFDNVVKYLKVGGMVMYSTCSILKLENEKNLEYFLEKYSDLAVEKLNLKNEKVDYIKLFPEKNKHNGFFMVKLKKIG